MTIAQKKLEVADQRIKSLETFIEDAVNTLDKKAPLEAKYDSSSGKHQIYIAKVPDLSSFAQDISIEVGIIANLLRSALDNQVFDLARANTNDQILHPKALQFPIVETKTQFTKEATRRLAELAPSVITLIEGFQPFHGIAGRPDSYSGPYIHQLSLLQEISNQDKHRTVVSIYADPNRFVIYEPATIISQAYDDWRSKNSKDYFDNFVPAPMEIGSVIEEAIAQNCMIRQPVFAGYAIAHITLDERRPLASTLNRVKNFVGMILENTKYFL